MNKKRFVSLNFFGFVAKNYRNVFDLSNEITIPKSEEERYPSKAKQCKKRYIELETKKGN